jgi:signal recognition particle GTPase
MKRENISKAFLEEKNKLEEENKKLKDERYRQKVMKDIELKTTKKVVTAIASGEITNPILEKDQVKLDQCNDVLHDILSNGYQNFQEKMGRNFTYGEMREMFG